MPAQYEIFPAQNLVVVTYFDRVTTEESVENFISYLISGDAVPGRSVLIDMSRVTELRISFDEMVALVSEKVGLMDPYEATMVTAFNCPSDETYEAALTYQHLVSGSDRQMVTVHRTRGDALRALGVASSDFADA